MIFLQETTDHAFPNPFSCNANWAEIDKNTAPRGLGSCPWTPWWSILLLAGSSMHDLQSISSGERPAGGPSVKWKTLSRSEVQLIHVTAQPRDQVRNCLYFSCIFLLSEAKSTLPDRLSRTDFEHILSCSPTSGFHFFLSSTRGRHKLYFVK